MTQKYRLIVLRNNPAALNNIELAQRISFSYGYEWPGGAPGHRNDVCSTCGADIAFDPNKKWLHSIAYDPKTYPDCSVVDEISGLNAELKNPALASLTITSKDGNVIATVFEDRVHFTSKTSRLVGCASVPKELLDRINPPEDRPLPMVEFHYPDGRATNQYRNSVTLLRRVKVTKLDGEWLYGFETVRGGTVNPEGTFKKFNVNRISGELRFLSFNR